MTESTYTLPPCPECASTYTYEMDPLLVCPECANEWDPSVTAESTESESLAIKDAVGNVLADGDDVTVVKTVKVKGAAQPIKPGTKVRGIRVLDTTDEHNIDCKVEGFGAMTLKSSIVRKA
ncbi:zinc ribbon domain-containing protein YjdM [Corynebacterium breve]|uniref:Zinc ribbon domain-containing protein YjdM n=1 Tax=Corynebacterium breve TaxID=3049799 RepID=A0ABY8VHJ4_9CORY|nr:zinc ribbon domain-containing protein YjdM [Corynebacterium breve]WIM68802.1 zinc ribbon domain-containing protein YjdM [Corynebacterium breve]